MPKELKRPDFAKTLGEIKDTAANEFVTNTLREYLRGIESDAVHLVTTKGVAVEEGGHIHEAVLTAVNGLQGVLPRLRDLSEFDAMRSADDVAVRKGKARYVSMKNRSRFRLEINLPFAVKMEYGGTIGVREPGGAKIDGGLYGKRSRRGRGYLIWQTPGGQARFTKTRTFGGASEGRGALNRAVEATDALARSRGWRPK